jgi:hypothetical protein
VTTDANRRLRVEVRAILALRTYVDRTAALWAAALPDPGDATLCADAQFETELVDAIRLIAAELLEERFVKIPAVVAAAAEQVFDDFAAAHPLD